MGTKWRQKESDHNGTISEMDSREKAQVVVVVCHSIISRVASFWNVSRGRMSTG